jgi:hypothetical protein
VWILLKIQIHFSTKNKVRKPVNPLNKRFWRKNKMFLHQPHTVKEDVKSVERNVDS